MVFQKVAPELLPWPVGVLAVVPMGWCSKSWGGVPKGCPRIPTLYTTLQDMTELVLLKMSRGIA